MNQYWHLLDWVPYRSPVAMFLIGLGIGGLIVQLANVLLAWRAHHARALDREKPVKVGLQPVHAHHARALDREDATRRRVEWMQMVNPELRLSTDVSKGFMSKIVHDSPEDLKVSDLKLFANVSWGDMMRYVEFPALPPVGALLILDDGDYSYALRIVNHEWYIERARAEVHVHCELVEKRGAK